MKANFKINTLRGIFFCLTRNKDGLCPRTVFSRTQKIKNVCLKRSFQFVGRRKLQIENPSPFARKEFAYFYAPFRSRPALFHFAKTKPARAPLRFKKANTFLSALGSTWPGGIENHFCQGAKMYNQSFRIGIPAPEW
jgi:hypothetical protein